MPWGFRVSRWDAARGGHLAPLDAAPGPSNVAPLPLLFAADVVRANPLLLLGFPDWDKFVLPLEENGLDGARRSARLCGRPRHAQFGAATTSECPRRRAADASVPRLAGVPARRGRRGPPSKLQLPSRPKPFRCVPRADSASLLLGRCPPTIVIESNRFNGRCGQRDAQARDGWANRPWDCDGAGCGCFFAGRQRRSGAEQRRYAVADVSPRS